MDFVLTKENLVLDDHNHTMVPKKSWVLGMGMGFYPNPNPYPKPKNFGFDTQIIFGYTQNIWVFHFKIKLKFLI
jgi:hypothetical protein